MADSSRIPDEDLSFAKLVLSQGIATPAQVEECLSLLRRLSESGVAPLPRLGELLAKKGYLQAGSDDRTLRASETPATSGSGRAPAAAALPPEAAEAAADPANLFGKYVRAAKLGAGGMGEVWKAWDRDLRRWAALKFLKVQDPDELARFKREAQTAGQLAHPNIAAVYDVGESQGRSFIAMQFVEGQTLQTFPRTDLRRVVETIRQAALAVHYAHEQGVIHRDLKPANLMVVEREPRAPGTRRFAAAVPRASANLHVYVMDFGLAKSTSVDASVSVSGSIVGTPLYMSPEQASGRSSIDARTDVWSLGATLYELLADRPPFRDPVVYALIKKVIEEEPRPLRKLRPKLDADLETVVMKCLEKDPARRYGSAAELAEELTRWLEGEPVLAHPPSLVYRVGKILAKRKAVAALGALALLLAAAFALYWIGWGREDRARAEEKRAEDELFGPILKRVEGLPAEPEGWRRGLELLDPAVARSPRSWQAWMRKGQLHEQLQETQPALEAYAKALSLNPRLGEAHFRSGRLRMDVLKDAAGARRDFERAQEVDPGNEYALVGRARVAVLQNDYRKALALCDAAEPSGRHVADLYFVRGFILGDRAGPVADLDRALKDFDESLRRQPWFPATWLNRGVVRKDKGDVQGAIADCTKALEINPRFAPAFINRGSARSELGDHARALEDLDRAVALDPSLPEAFVNRASARLGAGDFAGALADADRAIELKPGVPEAWFNRGRALKARGAHEAAIADFTKAFEIGYRTAVCRVLRGECRRARGDLPGSLADFEEALKIDPRSAEALVARGFHRQEQGELDGAIADYSEAIRHHPDRPFAWFNRGNVHRMKGRADAALADYDRALELDPKLVQAWVNRGTFRFAAKKDLEGALADLDAALKLDPRQVAAWTNRGLVHHTKGDLAAAIRDYDEAIRLDGKAADAWASRGGARQQQGNLEGAVADYRKALEVAPADWPRRAVTEGYLRRALGNR